MSVSPRPQGRIYTTLAEANNLAKLFPNIQAYSAAGTGRWRKELVFDIFTLNRSHPGDIIDIYQPCWQ